MIRQKLSYTLSLKETIPGDEKTTYMCTLLKGPELTSKHHVTKVAVGKVTIENYSDNDNDTRMGVAKLLRG